MVVDTNKFVAGAPPQPDFLTVLEQIPGTIVSQDQTQYLISNDYFPSYNRPFYPEVLRVEGFSPLCAFFFTSVVI